MAYDLPGVVTDRTAEQNARGFYQRWAALMEAKGWDEIPPKSQMDSARSYEEIARS